MRINLAQFVVITEERVYYLPLSRDDQSVIQSMAQVITERSGFTPVVIKDADDLVGIVTVHDGPSLPPGRDHCADCWHEMQTIAKRTTTTSRCPTAFLKAGGMRGRQLQVLVEGTYYINRLFATVEMIPKTVIEVGYVGVVVSYTGTSVRTFRVRITATASWSAGQPRCLERAASAGQICIQYLCRQGDHRCRPPISS